MVERDRCRALIEALDGEQAFLLYCIDNIVYPQEIEQHRVRFSEFQDPEIEGLM